MSGQVRWIMVDTRPIAGQDTDPSSGPWIRRADIEDRGSACKPVAMLHKGNDGPRFPQE